MSQLFSTAVAAQDISTPKLVKTWTATASYDDLKLRVLLSGLTGNGSYQACCTVQPGGAGPAYQTPTSTGFCAATVTTIWLPSIAFSIASGDVLRVYVQGLAGDTSIDAVIALWEGADVELGLTTQGYTTTRAPNLDNLDVAVSTRAMPGDTMALTPTERNDIADALLDRADAIEVGLTLRQALRIMAAVAAGRLSGAKTKTIRFRNAAANDKDRVTATVDGLGNRTDVTLDVS